MRILVVDDEYYIVKNIIETTDWSALGIEQAFPAYSASQAKRIFEGSQDIDILLTDIEMPRETGLQLVEWLHENNSYNVHSHHCLYPKIQCLQLPSLRN